MLVLIWIHVHWLCATVLVARRYRMIGIVGCCERAASGHATAAPPMSVMHSRRFISDYWVFGFAASHGYRRRRETDKSDTCAAFAPALHSSGQRTDHKKIAVRTSPTNET